MSVIISIASIILYIFLIDLQKWLIARRLENLPHPDWDHWKQKKG